MASIEKIIVAIYYSYGEGASKDNIAQTDVYFNDGTTLQIRGYWVFKPGESYTIEYTNGNPVTISNVNMKL